MADYIEEIIGAVCYNVVVSKHADFDIDDYDEVRERIKEILEKRAIESISYGKNKSFNGGQP